MSDSRCRYLAMKCVLKQLYPTDPQGNLARHLNTLSALAGKVPDGTKKESRVKKVYRWVQNEYMDVPIYFLPFIQYLRQNPKR